MFMSSFMIYIFKDKMIDQWSLIFFAKYTLVNTEKTIVSGCIVYY